MNTNIVVTGGRGFIGAATVRELENRGHNAWMFDRDAGHNIMGSLAMLQGADTVVHLAGVLGTAELFDNPEQAIAVNVLGAVRILDWCAENEANYVGITMPDSSWANVYQATKLCAGRLATAWHRNFDLGVSHVRAFNAYGPGQRYGAGHPQKIIPHFATLAWQGLALPIWGSGNQTVDLVHVDDVAKTLADAVVFTSDEVLDAGTGTAVTVNQVASFVNRVTGNQGGVIHLPMRPGEEPDTNIVAKGHGWEAMGWKPEFSWDRLQETVESYKP